MENRFIGRRIAQLSRSIKRTVDSEYLNRINIGLTVEEGMLVERIGRFGGKAQTKQLLDAMKVSKSTLSEVLSSLERKGYIVYARASSDKRRKNVVLTQKGQEHVERTVRVFSEFEDRLIKGISEEDLLTIERVYHRMLLNLGEEGE